MTELDIQEKDLQKAELFLETYLSERFPEADFSRGTALRDHTIGAIATVYALLMKEATNIRNATSLRLVANIEDDNEFTQAVENLVDSWFIRRKPGRRVRGTVLVHFTQRHSGRIPSLARFTRRAGVSFMLDDSRAMVYSENDMSPRINAQGEVSSYVLRVPVVAENVGVNYEISEGEFANITPFSPYIQYAENVSAFTGARNPESPEDLIDRAPDALTKRDLSSNRSIRAVLRDEFTAIDRVVVQGMGDEAMRRDLFKDPNAYYQVHLGGHTDAYVSTPVRRDRVYEAEVGGQFTDPRGSVRMFRDATVDDWRALATPGDILQIHNAAASEPRLYKIVKVSRHYLEVHKRQPFPDARPIPLRNQASFTAVRVIDSETVRCVNAQFSERDVGHFIRLNGSTKGNNGTYRIVEVDTENDRVVVADGGLTIEESASLSLKMYRHIVEYSIGDIGPEYTSKVSPRMTGEFSQVYQEDGRVLLPSEPVYRIKEVSILSPDAPGADPITGRITFGTRVNRPVEAKYSGGREYRVVCDEPEVAPSMHQKMVLDLKFSPEKTGRGATLDTHPDGALLTTLDAAFDADDQGKLIHIRNAAYPENRGDFRLVEVINTEEAVISHTADTGWEPVPEARLKWGLHNARLFNDKTVRVVYDTVDQFDAINSFVQSRNNHIACANTLVKAFHPVYVSFDLDYHVRTDAESFLDHSEAVKFLTGFVNSFPETDTITVSDIVSAFYTEFNDVVSRVQMPLKLYYTLYAPDGRAIRYRTQDEVTIRGSHLVDSSSENRLEDALDLGVTEQTVRYIADESLIRVRQATQ